MSDINLPFATGQEWYEVWYLNRADLHKWIQGYAKAAVELNRKPSGQVSTTPPTAYSTAYTVSPDTYWQYTTPPTGTKLYLLTKGGVSVDGLYRPDGGFIGWNPLFKRNRELEEKLGLA